MSYIAGYTGQQRKLRDLAIENLGIEQVAKMSDSEIADWVEGTYAIFWGDKEDGLGSHDPTSELLVLIPSDKFHELVDRSEIIFIER